MWPTRQNCRCRHTPRIQLSDYQKYSFSNCGDRIAEAELQKLNYRKRLAETNLWRYCPLPATSAASQSSTCHPRETFEYTNVPHRAYIEDPCTRRFHIIEGSHSRRFTSSKGFAEQDIIQKRSALCSGQPFHHFSSSSSFP